MWLMLLRPVPVSGADVTTIAQRIMTIEGKDATNPPDDRIRIPASVLTELVMSLYRRVLQRVG